MSSQTTRLAIGSFINEDKSVYEIRHFLTTDGKDVYLEWRRKLTDMKARIAIDRRINRIELGNLGDHKFLADGVWELRIDVGPGYRVYYALSGPEIVLLLCGGDKRTQDADIVRASRYWRDWQRRD
ncbi:MAG TPA: type II toxin-antitoxin system RelE/ParE family toxin [Acidobacteriaceae bacterium]|jgi:putative addiction module killer protein|nr:type II toxin-antitoxin system RelE/ParE family toxin [Acidobacteriaceae bacterium]